MLLTSVVALALAAAGASGCKSTSAWREKPVPRCGGDEPVDSDLPTELARAIDSRLAAWPAKARTAGLHDYDGQVAKYDRMAIERRGAAVALQLIAIDGYHSQQPNEALDRELMLMQLGYERFELKRWRVPYRDPRFYEELFDVGVYINFDYAPIEQRAQKLLAHEKAALEQVPNVFANLEPVLSRPVVETSIGVFSGYAKYLRGDVANALLRVGDEAFQADFKATNEKLAQAAGKIAARLQYEFLPKADQSHVLGKAMFLELVAAQEGREYSLRELKRMADEDLANNKAAFEALAPKVTVTRPKADELLTLATKQMNAARQFVIEKKLMTIPSEDRAELRESPAYMRWNAAFLNMPGPFDTAKQGFYYITLPDPSWPKEEQEGYIFPQGVLMATTVHEVYPGHFLQGLWARRAPTRAQKLVDSYSFIEGWAHYTEQLMMEEGFGAEDPQNRLGQLSDALLRNCRFVAAIGIHVEGMSLEEAARRFREDCKQDAATARQQAIRGTFDPGYFAYTLGKVQILKLRKRAKESLGNKFSLQAFHDALLSHGNGPVPLVAPHVLQELGVAAN